MTAQVLELFPDISPSQVDPPKKLTARQIRFIEIAAHAEGYCPWNPPSRAPILKNEEIDPLIGKLVSYDETADCWRATEQGKKLVATNLKKNPPKKQKGKPNYTAEFESFWQAYPPRFNSSKLDAFTAWQRLDDEDRALIMEVMPTFIAWARTKEEKHLPHASTWLNGRRFETIRRPIVVPSPTSPQVDWAKAKRIFEATGRWSAELGPEPGAPGSRCP